MSFANGEEGVLLDYDGKVLTLTSPSAYAPGAPLKASLEGEAHETVALDLKSIGSKRADDGRFVVRARFRTVTRATRAAVEAWRASR